jgi:4-amino-4-deoxy-L-arabinose transferase-like glycosyltransferase
LSQASQAKQHRRVTLGSGLTLLGLLAALARLPLIRTAVDVSPDGCEYLGIARHLVTEGRWVSSLKWHFFTDGPLVHPALADRPPLYPLWAALWMTLSPDPETQVWLARCGNLLLAAALASVLYWALCAAVRPAAAALAAGIFLIYPAFLRNSSQPLTEPLFLLLMFASLGLFLRARDSWRWIGAGLFAGLASLTRPSGVLLLLLYLVALRARRNQESGWATGPSQVSGPGPYRMHPSRGRLPALRSPLLLMTAGFLIPLLPYFAGVASQTGSPFTSVLRYNYSILHIDEGTLDGFERDFVPPAQFVWAHRSEVAEEIGHQWAAMGTPLARSLQFVLPLAVFWRRGMGWERSVLIGLAVLNFLFHAMSWTVWGAARYMFPSYILVMALLLDAPLRWVDQTEQRGDGRPFLPWARGGSGQPGYPVTASTGRRRLVWSAIGVAVALTLAVCVEQDVRLYQEKSKPFAGVELGWAYATAAGRLAGAKPGTIRAANQPWIVNLLVRQPTVMAPRFRDVAQLRRYVARYQPTTLTLFVTERRLADARAALVLVDNLWHQPRLRPELKDLLVLETAQTKPGPPHRQALLMFRIQDQVANQSSLGP